MYSLTSSYVLFLSLFLSSMSNFPATAVDTSIVDFIPWSWQVGPNAVDETEDFCPSTLSILGTFAIINVLVSLFGLVAGNRTVVAYVTCGCCSGDDDDPTWFYMFIFPLGLNLGPNALIAYLYKTTPGFGDTFSIWDLTLFYTTRPRLSWLLLVIFMNIDALRASNTHYIRSAKAAVAAEVVLQLMSSYYMGRTVHFAADKEFYSHPGTAPEDARVMYAGALLSLVSLFFTLLSLIYILFSDAEYDTSFFVVVLIGCTSWLGSWIFWGGFVGLAGNL